MLTMAWTELESISVLINYLQGERNAARMSNDARRVGELAVELGQAINARDSLVARIGALVGDGAQSAGTPAQMLAAA